MKLKLILLSVITLLVMTNCTPKVEYIQPDLPTLPHYYVEPIDGTDYEIRSNDGR